MERDQRHGKDASASLTPIHIGRGILNSVVLASFTVILFFVSCIAFFLFYHYNVPAIGVQKTAHLQYHTGLNPHATIDLEFSAAQLTISQPYDIIVELVLPNSPTNHEVGNFMVSIDMFSSDETSLIKSSRPAIMTYSSPLISTLSTVLASGPILAGIRSESQTLRVPVLESYQFSSGWLSDPSHARIELSSPDLRVYGARVLFETRLGGLPLFLYRFRLTSFVIFTSLFWLSSVLAMMVAYAVVSLSADSVVATGGRGHPNRRPQGSTTTRRGGGGEDTTEPVKAEPVEPSLRPPFETAGSSTGSGGGSSISSAQFFQFEPTMPPVSQRRGGAGAGGDRTRARTASVSSDATTIFDDSVVKKEFQ